MTKTKNPAPVLRPVAGVSEISSVLNSRILTTKTSNGQGAFLPASPAEEAKS